MDKPYLLSYKQRPLLISPGDTLYPSE